MTEPFNARPGRRPQPGKVLDARLDALVAAQEEDGGWPWPVHRPIWTPVAGMEWRSSMTIESLLRLRAYGRRA